MQRERKERITKKEWYALGGFANSKLFRTRKARPDDYADLLAELTAIYGRSNGPDDPAYSLRVYQRMTPQPRKAFNAEVARLNRLARESA